MKSNESSTAELPIAVIGAGPCGLAACKTLKEFGIAFECFESTDRVGGVWNVEGGGSGYRSLHTNTSTRAMAYSDFAFDQALPIHPSAKQLLSYFESYAKYFKVLDSIHFETKVQNVVQRPDDIWCVTTEKAGRLEEQEFSNVVIATGKYSKPNLPHDEVDGEFAGAVMHSSAYLDAQAPANLNGKTVLVVGLGSSAVEIASDLAKNGAQKVLLSARSGRWVIPKTIEGTPADSAAPHPSQALPFPLSYLPQSVGSWLTRRVMGSIFRKHFKTQQALLSTKLPEPKMKPWADRPTLSSDFIPCLQQGLIDLRPEIKRFDGDQVYFVDDSTAHVDAIIYATGYHIDLPFMDDSLDVMSGHDLRLYQNIVHPKLNGLYFIGYCPVMCSLWPLAEQQSRWLARLLQNRFSLPDSGTQARKTESMSKSLPIICNFYVEMLRKQAGGLKS